jgi:hypothetical protein
MKFKKVSFLCECGQSASRIDEVGLTTAHQLVIRWWCMACKRDIFVVKSLSDYWGDCPEEEESGDAQPPLRPEDAAVSDVQFLRMLGIRCPEESES